MTRAKKILLFSIAFLIVFCLAFILLSSYKAHEKFPYKLVQHSVHINARVEKVFAYLGNSKNASTWSVFVDHITTLNAAEVPDGKPGSRRRCFVSENERGIQWNELITEVVQGKKRQLSIYNMVDFPISANNLLTEQLYENAPGNTCNLTFTVFFNEPGPTFAEKLKMYFASYKIKSIFKQNMDNIKREVELNSSSS